MVDLDETVRRCLRRHAEDAPAPGYTLDAVHGRAGRIRRRRRSGLVVAGVVAGLLVGVPSAIAGIGRDPAGSRPAGHAPSESPASASPLAPASPTAPAPGASGSSAPPGAPTPIRLAAPAFAVPAFGYQPPSAGIPVGGLEAPVITLENGALLAYYAAHDPVRGADVTIVVGPDRPTFPVPAARVTEAPRTVRGHAGTLRTVAVSPAAELVLYWRESASRWVQVRTDDTLTESELIGFANGLSPASLPVPLPFRLDLAPAGLPLDTATRGSMAFRSPGAANGARFTCTLYDSHPLTGSSVRVGSYRGTLTRDGTGATLTVRLDDQQATLVVQAPAGYSVSDADLIRFAAGVHLTDRAEPQDR